MNKLNFYSDNKSSSFFNKEYKSICFLGACTSRNLAHGISYYSGGKITTYSPYETIFNLPSLYHDLLAVLNKVDHTLIKMDDGNYLDKIRYWNISRNKSKVIRFNKMIDKQVKKFSL